MYGTVARLKIKPGKEAELQRISDENTANLNGFLFHYVYRLDSGNDEYMLVVGFESKEAYVANANSPEQNENYLRFRELMAQDPEWNDGEIVHSHVA